MSQSDKFARFDTIDDSDQEVEKEEASFKSGSRRVPLEKFQIQRAKEYIEEMHPIKDTDLDVAFPKVGCLCKVFLFLSRCCRRGGDDLDEEEDENVGDGGLRQVLQQKNKALVANKQYHEDADNDPYMQLGFGMMAYRNLLESLILCFFILTCLIYPVTQIYSKGDGYTTSKDTHSPLSTKYMLGNMGYSTTQCQLASFELRRMALQCPYGKISQKNELIFGINEYGLQPTQKQQCVREPTKIEGKSNIACSQLIDKDWFTKEFEARCEGKDLCKFQKQEIIEHMDKTDADLAARCSDDGSLFFVQYQCIQDEATQNRKWGETLIVTCVYLAVTLTFSTFIFYQKSLTKLNAVKYDISTVTASDFTVEMDISDEAYAHFLKNEYEPKGKSDYYSQGLYLKQYLKKKMEDVLNRYSAFKEAEGLLAAKTIAAGADATDRRSQARRRSRTDSLGDRDDDRRRQYENPLVSQASFIKDQFQQKLTQKVQRSTDRATTNIVEKVFHPYMDKRPVKIAEITFAYNNHEMIELLKSRGHYIQKENWSKVKQYDEKIEQFLQDQEHCKKLVQPVCAFIVFETAKAQDIAIEYSERCHKKELGLSLDLPQETIFNQMPKFQTATNPTNIIWENRHIKGSKKKVRHYVGVLAISLFLALSFVLIWLLKQKQVAYVKEHSEVDCESIKAIYWKHGDAKQKLKFAFKEYNIVQGRKDVGAPVLGNLACFCIEQENEGIPSDKEYTYKGESKKLCQDLLHEKFVADAFGSLMSCNIVIINYFLRLLIIRIVEWIGKPTVSREMTTTTFFVFISQYINTGLLLPIANAELTHQFDLNFEHARVLYILLRGDDPDFNRRWYKSVGQTLLTTMIVNIIAPVVEFMIGFIIRRVRICFDRGCCRKEASTKQTTLQGYIDVYAGPEYQIHYKYSSILNVVFVTMTFGVGIPILFPCALFFLVGLYFMEKLLLYYYYRQPPQYDESLNDRVLSVLTFTPLLLLSFGYWFLSNKQLLSNEFLEPAPAQTVEHDPQHYAWEVFQIHKAFTNLTPACPLLVTFWLYFVYYLAITLGGPDFFQKRTGKWRCCRWCQIASPERDTQATIDEYWRCLDDDDRAWSQVEERNSRDHLKMQTMFDSAMQGLQSNRMGRCHLTGTHTYDILRNPSYWQAFQYIAASVPERNKFIKDGDDDDGNNSYQSDLVRLVLNLSFLSEDELNHFSFNKNLHMFQQRRSSACGQGQEREGKDVIDFVDIIAHKAIAAREKDDIRRRRQTPKGKQKAAKGGKEKKQVAFAINAEGDSDGDENQIRS